MVLRFKKKSGTASTYRAFVAYAKKNPRLWGLFKRYTLQVIRTGKKAYSCRAIMHRLRWHMEITTRGDDFKIGNNSTPYYARMFHAMYPEHPIFRVRKLKSTSMTEADLTENLIVLAKQLSSMN